MGLRYERIYRHSGTRASPGPCGAPGYDSASDRRQGAWPAAAVRPRQVRVPVQACAPGEAVPGLSDRGPGACGRSEGEFRRSPYRAHRYPLPAELPAERVRCPSQVFEDRSARGRLRVFNRGGSDRPITERRSAVSSPAKCI